MSQQHPPPPPVPERTSHPFLTHDMIYSIPAAIESTLSGSGERLSAVGKELKSLRSLFFTGCGTAFFASMAGQEFNRPSADSPVRTYSVQALELQSHQWGVSSSSAVIGVSHSGITKTTVDALRLSRRLGARTTGITHFHDRPIGEASDDLFVVGDGPDTSRMHTKCYVDSAVAASLLSIEGGSVLGSRGDWADKATDGLYSLPGLSSRLLSSVESRCRELAEKNAETRRFYFAGTGPNVTTALEAALKFKETSYLAAEGMETEQLMHGPWVSLDKECHLTIIAPGGQEHVRVLDLAKCAKLLGVRTLCIVKEGEKDLTSLCDDSIEVPGVEDYLTPFLTILPLYFFAYYSSVSRGHNPDYLRYLDPLYWKGRGILFPPGTH